MKHNYYKVTWKKDSHIGKPFTYYREVKKTDFLNTHIEILDFGNPYRKGNPWSYTVFRNISGLKSHTESVKVEEINESEIDDYLLQIDMMKELAR